MSGRIRRLNRKFIRIVWGFLILLWSEPCKYSQRKAHKVTRIDSRESSRYSRERRERFARTVQSSGLIQDVDLSTEAEELRLQTPPPPIPF